MMLSRLRFLFLVAASLSLAVSESNAAIISGTANTQHSHNTGTLESPFFTEATNQSGAPVYSWMAAQGLSGSIVSGSAGSTTVSGTITIAGNSTSGGGFTDGNSIPDGVTLSFPLSFDISTATGANLITAGGNTGNGLSVANDGSQLHGALEVGETLDISAATIGAPTWAGAPSEPGYTFLGGAAGGSQFVGFRANNFNEASNGATLSDGTDSVGFGTSLGSSASNTVINNNTAPTFSVLGLDVASTLSTDQGTWNLKGFTLEHSFDYEISAIPEPATFAGLSAMLATLVGVKRRR